MSKKKHSVTRLPNGLGSAHLIGDGRPRRCPWRARVADGGSFDPVTGQWRRKYITLGYFQTQPEAIEALCNYHRNPYTAEAATITFAGIFQQWKVRKYPEVGPSAQRGYEAAFKNSAQLHDLRMRDIRACHMEQALTRNDLQYGSRNMMKSLWNQLFTYALQRDIVQKNYASFVHLRNTDPGTTRTAVSQEDMARLWQLADSGDWTAQLFMVYCYTGMRSSELLQVRKEDVDLQGRILVGGLKTAAGKHRRIPLHRDILPILRRLMSTPGELLVMEQRKGLWQPVSYHRWYYVLLKPLMDRLGMPYTCHYARHTCATMLREANVADDLRKLILGHANGDITERYTHHPDYMLLAAIDQIPRRKKATRRRTL